MRGPIFINGKFLTAPPTGVQRVGEELIRALHRRIIADPMAYDGAFSVAEPRGARRTLGLAAIPATRFGALPPLLWEQIELPWKSRGGTSLNLCNAGPLLSRNAVTMVHDAQVYISPQSYSRPFRLWYRFMQPLLGRRHRLILTVSEFSKQQLVSYGIAPASKIRVVPNGADHINRVTADDNALSALDLEAGSYVLSLASLMAHKNIGVLIEAFRDPSLGQLKLAVFGSADRTALEGEFGPLPANIAVLGKISDGQLRALLENALCFACPSLTEGFGLPVAEAMTLGCPAVVAPCGALPEVCGDAALYADPHDAQAWAKAFTRLSADPDLRLSLSIEGKIRAKRFSWDSAAKTLLDTLVELDA